MDNAIDLKPNIIIRDDYEGFLVLDAWEGFQSRQGPYNSQDSGQTSAGQIKVSIEGIPIDYVKIVSNAQVAAIHYLVDHSEDIKEAILKGLLKKFPDWKDIYEDYLPDIVEPNQFKDFIGLSYLHIMSAEKDSYAYIGFEFGCTWNEEHGLGVMMHKEWIIEIGQADSSFDTWLAHNDNGTIEMEKWKAANERIVAGEKAKINIKPWWKFWQ